MATEFSNCPFCGQAFKAFRSGYTFGDVAEELYPKGNPEDWLRPFTRKVILATLKDRKARAWRDHMDTCSGQGIPT